MASLVDEGGLWRVGTRESKGFCETKFSEVLCVSSVRRQDQQSVQYIHKLNTYLVPVMTYKIIGFRLADT